MGINIYEFFELTMDKFSDYTDRYNIELQDFLSKYEDNTESLFIEYQRGYLKKHREAIISNMNEIEKEDPDGELIFSVLEKKLATNVKIFEFLEHRKAELRSAPAPVVGSESKEVNASKDYSFGFFNDVNNGLVTKFDMITFLEPHNTIEKLQALIEAIEGYKVKYIVDGMVYNETNKRPFSEDSFNDLKELVFSEIEKLKNIHTGQKMPDTSTKKADYTKMPWFIVGLNIANGEVKKLLDKDKNLANGKIALSIGLKYEDGPHISKSKLLIPCKSEKSRNNVFNYPEKIKLIHEYCINNRIQMTKEFEEIVLKYSSK